jgi:hypothetical protein
LFQPDDFIDHGTVNAHIVYDDRIPCDTVPVPDNPPDQRESPRASVYGKFALDGILGIAANFVKQVFGKRRACFPFHESGYILKRRGAVVNKTGKEFVKGQVNIDKQLVPVNYQHRAGHLFLDSAPAQGPPFRVAVAYNIKVQYSQRRRPGEKKDIQFPQDSGPPDGHEEEGQGQQQKEDRVVLPPFPVVPGEVPDNDDYAEQEKDAVINGTDIVGNFKLPDIKVAAQPPGNKTETAGYVPGIDQSQDAYKKGDDVKGQFPVPFVGELVVIVKAELGGEQTHIRPGAALYPVSGKGRLQCWGNFFDKTAEGIQGNYQGGAEEIFQAGLAPVIEDKDQHNDADYQVKAGYNLRCGYVHILYSMFPRKAPSLLVPRKPAPGQFRIRKGASLLQRLLQNFSFEKDSP